MKRIFVYITICLASVVMWNSCACKHDENAQLLRELDHCIDVRAEYTKEREYRIDSLHALLKNPLSHDALFEQYGRLVEEYRSYNLDSQLYYSEARLEMAQTPFERQVSRLNYAEGLMRNGMFHESLNYMDSALQTPLDPVLDPYYSHLRRTIYGLMRDFACTRRERQTYTAITQHYREQMMQVHPAGSFLHELVRADYLYEQQLYDSALHVLDGYARQHDIAGQDEEAVFAVTRAHIYHALGNKEQEKHYLAISAIADLQHAIREYISLRELSVLLYEEGDIDRAYSYMRCAASDAMTGSARVRSIELSSVFPVVERAYHKSVRRQQYWMLGGISAGVIILLLLIMFQFYIHQENTQLASLNADLAQRNGELLQSNHIKEVYVGHYMEMTSRLIDRYDERRKEMKTLLQAENYRKLSDILSSHQFTQTQIDAFYRDFDEAFMHICPNFVEQVRELLVPEAEIRIKPDERLNTDLRVLALIKLGITDSKQIAQMLRYSLSTIYNSRTRMRNLAKGDRDLFEHKIAEL